jgi:hypothetical protein
VTVGSTNAFFAVHICIWVAIVAPSLVVIVPVFRNEVSQIGG